MVVLTDKLYSCPTIDRSLLTQNSCFFFRQRTCRVHGWNVNEGKGAQVLQRLMDVWETLKRADANSDGSVSTKKFLFFTNQRRLDRHFLIPVRPKLLTTVVTPDQAGWLSNFRSIKTSGAQCGNSTQAFNIKDRTIGRKNIEISCSV